MVQLQIKPMDSSSRRKEVVPPIPDLLKGGRGSWAGSTACGLNGHRLAGSVWQVAVTNTGSCFWSHEPNKCLLQSSEYFGSVQYGGFVDVVVSF